MILCFSFCYIYFRILRSNTLSLSSYAMAAIKHSAAGIAYPAGASGLSPVLMIFVLLFSFRCRDFSMILCLFVLFLSAIFKFSSKDSLLSIMKRKFRQWWSTIPTISIKQTITSHRGSSWSYSRSIYNYLCYHCLSPLLFCVRIPLMVRCTRYNLMW